MSAETKKVLEMLAAGKISQEDAEKLLDKLSGTAQSPQRDAANSQSDAARNTSTSGPAGGVKRPQFLRIQIEKPNGKNSDIRVPLSTMRGGAHWMAFLPTWAAEKLSEHGCNWASLDTMTDEQFRRALDRISVDIQSSGGKHIRIYPE